MVSRSPAPSNTRAVPETSSADKPTTRPESGKVVASPNDERTAFAIAALDLKSVSVAKKYRFLSLAHLQDTQDSAEEMLKTRKAVTKILNSLSWKDRIIKPTAIDEKELILRIDLAEFGWNPGMWDTLTKDHPSATSDIVGISELSSLTGSAKALIRADWFVAMVSTPPFYYQFLEMPQNLATLEAKLGVSLQNNVDAEKVIRAGFDNSLVSQDHRVIERHQTGSGFLWRSYEFGRPVGQQNIFENPLGPTRGVVQSQSGSRVFVPAGGEMFFSLPNGMLAFLVVNTSGQRLDEIPLTVGKPIVAAGASCMRCHKGGPLDKEDQVRSRVEAQNKFPSSLKDKVLNLYVEHSEFQRVISEDQDQFGPVLKKMGILVEDSDPVSAVRAAYFDRKAKD
jgi:hypothetical protein